MLFYRKFGHDHISNINWMDGTGCNAFQFRCLPVTIGSCSLDWDRMGNIDAWYRRCDWHNCSRMVSGFHWAKIYYAINGHSRNRKLRPSMKLFRFPLCFVCQLYTINLTIGFIDRFLTYYFCTKCILFDDIRVFGGIWWWCFFRSDTVNGGWNCRGSVGFWSNYL